MAIREPWPQGGGVPQQGRTSGVGRVQQALEGRGNHARGDRGGVGAAGIDDLDVGLTSTQLRRDGQTQDARAQNNDVTGEVGHGGCFDRRGTECKW